MKPITKFYFIAVLFCFATVLLFGFLLPAGFSYDDDFIVILSAAGVVFYIPFAIKMTRELRKNIDEYIKEKNS